MDDAYFCDVIFLSSAPPFVICLHRDRPPAALGKEVAFFLVMLYLIFPLGYFGSGGDLSSLLG
jgi:hypothetical protein